MRDDQRVAILPCESQGSFERCVYRVWPGIVIEKYIAFDRRHSKFACDVKRNGLGCGARVQKKETALAKALHQPFHRFAMLGQQTAGMVGKTDACGHGVQGGAQHIVELALRHVEGQGAVFDTHMGCCVWLHRLMQDDVFAGNDRAMCKQLSVWREREYGERNGPG